MPTGPEETTARRAGPATRRAGGSFGSLRWTPRGILLLGSLFIAVFIGLAACDIVLGYRAAVSATGRRLESQAQVIAEQTARSLQAVDVVLRHLVEQAGEGRFAGRSPADLHAYLQEQSVGLVQVDGLLVVNADGSIRATSYLLPGQEATINVSALAQFHALQADTKTPISVGAARRSDVDGQWIFPVARRLTNAHGRFNGAVAARGRIEYFQDFYKDLRLDRGTKVTLMHDDGTLVARYPALESALGRPVPRYQEARAAYDAGRPEPMRAISPLDGVERFAVMHDVAGYPLSVAVVQDVSVALAPWRKQAIGTAVRTLALGGLAALLLAIVLRQLNRLSAAHASLEVSRERFALAVGGSDDGLWDLDFAANRAFASARCREILGLPAGPEAQRLDEWMAICEFHPDDEPERCAAIDAHLAGRTPFYAGEHRVRQRDGSYRWARFRGLCVRDANGKPYRMAGSVTDIDARKRAEVSLRESEERFALAVAGSNDGILDWDIANDRMFTSVRAMRIAGVESDVTVRTRAEWVDLLKIHPDDFAEYAEEWRRHLEGLTDVRDGEHRVMHPDGVYRWVRLRGTCVRDADGNPIRFAGSVADIDAQKRVEQALRQSEERFQLAVLGANQGLWDWNLTTDRLYLSPRAQEMKGFAAGEPVRSRREWIALCHYHPDDVETLRRAISAHLHGATSHYSVEYRLRHSPSGPWHWCRERGIALRDDHGRPFRMAGSMEDISEAKRAEAERDRLELQLRQAQKLEAIGTLAGGIAHDFNNILAAILGYGELAQQDLAEASRPRRHLDAAMNAGMRAKSLVERILAFSRGGVAERAPVHVQSVVNEALDLVAAALPTGVVLDRRLTAGDAGVLGDPTQVHQVVMNLCANAIQAIKSTGTLTVTLDVTEMTRTVVATSTLEQGNYLRLCVRDTGSGIPPQIRERMFDPFFTTKEVGVGTGLGLSLVHGIVTDLGGGIDIESRPGNGATFSVYLPWQCSVAKATKVEAAVPGGAGETILLVDDEDALVRMGEEMIAGLGYEPVGFTSSVAALQTFRAEPERFQAILSDESMPDLTGSELAREVLRIRPDIPIVLMSGYVTSSLAARARDAGVREVLSKPLVARDIARSLATVLQAA
ncbi:MAG TPA: PAS domain-containing protein [Burkholderiaceae bacterium]|nr:PAS domain-containing protein [Burkholderiaceae bacterium]